MRTGEQAFLFDLYGTLLRTSHPGSKREVPRVLGLTARAWARIVREHLFVESFVDAADMVEAVCRSGDVNPPAAARARAVDLLQQEVASVEPIEGALGFLRFLQRRGHPLGVVSNLSSLHTKPFSDLGLDEIISSATFSCETGMAKPDPEIYRTACRGMGVDLERVACIGDSLLHDVRAPREQGMLAFHVGTPEIPSAAHLAWIDTRSEPGDSLVDISGSDLPSPSGPVPVAEIRPLGETEQGRYNMVARLPGDLFAKRFLLPEAVYVETFAREIMRIVDVDYGAAAISNVTEPILVTETARGELLTRSVSEPGLAEEIGRHFALACLLGNADIRPRNTFVEQTAAGPRVCLIDLEYMFFFLALDTTGLERPDLPETFDRMSQGEIDARVKRRVLTPRTGRRVVKEYLGEHRRDHRVARAFQDGWHAGYESARLRESELIESLLRRISQAPPLIIGTRAYRRAMASFDVQDIELRIRQDPGAAFADVTGLAV